MGEFIFLFLFPLVYEKGIDVGFVQLSVCNIRSTVRWVREKTRMVLWLLLVLIDRANQIISHTGPKCAWRCLILWDLYSELNDAAVDVWSA